ncbi:MAG: periplasmic chaperone [Pedosphaera sp.]|nr:periplasmic chaperone [Pedosphaera sp.]
MLRILPVLVVAAALMMASEATAQNKIATIDLHKVFDKYWKRQQAENALKEHRSTLEKEVKSMLEDYKKTEEEYKKLEASAYDQAVSPEERDKRKAAAVAKLEEIKTSQNTINTYENSAQEKLNLEVQRMTDAILQDIRALISAKAKAAGYTLVVDTAAETRNFTPVVLYTNGDNDMTDTILAQLNAGAPSDSNTGTNSVTTPKAGDKTGSK